MSDIRVSVQWKSSTVFAGEDIECTITFNNVSQPNNLRRSPSPSTQLRHHGSSRERWKETLPHRSVQGAATYGNNTSPSMLGFPHPNTRSHKPALSLSTSNGFPLARMPNASEGASRPRSSEINTHRRSVSIVSIGGDRIDEAPPPGPILSSARPARSHVRAASLQLLSRRAGSSNGGSSGSQSLYSCCSLANPSVSARTGSSLHRTVSDVPVLELFRRAASRYASRASINAADRP